MFKGKCIANFRPPPLTPWNLSKRLPFVRKNFLAGKRNMCQQKPKLVKRSSLGKGTENRLRKPFWGCGAGPNWQLETNKIAEANVKMSKMPKMLSFPRSKTLLNPNNFLQIVRAKPPKNQGVPKSFFGKGAPVMKCYEVRFHFVDNLQHLTTLRNTLATLYNTLQHSPAYLPNVITSS